MQGFYNIIKPTGISSAGVVSKIKKITKQKRVGHLGTLDPSASGVLTVAVGKATRFFDYFLKKDKVYFAIAEFGVKTDTLDSEGNILEKDTVNVNKKDVENQLHNFIGEIEQIPPIYSAININGKRAYELARSGQEVEIPKRKIKIYIDLKPALSNEELDSRIRRDFEEIKNKEFKNSLEKLLPKKIKSFFFCSKIKWARGMFRYAKALYEVKKVGVGG